MTRKLLASAALATSLLAAGCSSSGQAMAGSSGAMSGSPTANVHWSDDTNGHVH